MRDNRPFSDRQAGDPERIVIEPRQRAPGALRLKRVVQWLFGLWVLPRVVICRLGRRIWGEDRAFLAASESIARLPGMWGVYCRQAFYRRFLAGCGRDVYFGWQSVFSMTAAEVGEGAYIGRHCGIGFARIGDHVMLADGVQILSGGREHGRASDPGELLQDQPQELRRVVIGRGAWLGTNAVVMADVGQGSVIGAGAVVTRPIPPGVVAAGVPARIIKELPYRDG